MTRNEISHKPTIGFISTWPVYQGTTIDRYAHSLIQGISAAANEHGCNLLLEALLAANFNQIIGDLSSDRFIELSRDHVIVHA